MTSRRDLPRLQRSALVTMTRSELVISGSTRSRSEPQVNWSFKAPVRPGDTITGEVEVIKVRADKPITELETRVVRADRTVVLDGSAVCYTMPLQKWEFVPEDGSETTPPVPVGMPMFISAVDSDARGLCRRRPFLTSISLQPHAALRP